MLACRMWSTFVKVMRRGDVFFTPDDSSRQQWYLIVCGMAQLIEVETSRGVSLVAEGGASNAASMLFAMPVVER